jgi:hypothetical protein
MMQTPAGRLRTYCDETKPPKAMKKQQAPKASLAIKTLLGGKGPCLVWLVDGDDMEEN